MDFEKISGYFSSSDGENEIKYFIYLPKCTPSAVVQISHGMCEYIERYENEGFVSALTSAGFVVCGNDHLGHGGSVKADDDLGFFRDYNNLVDDLHILNGIIKKRFPSLPYILFGHSMGSFTARAYVTRYDDIDGAVFSGTMAGNQPLSLARALAKAVCGFKGERHRSPLLDKLAFGGNNKEFSKENDTASWLSRDESVRRRYRDDKYCSFKFTAAAMRELFGLLIEISGEEWVNKVPLSLPIYMVSGDADPLSEKGEGIRQIYSALEDVEINELKMKLYPKARHEIYNDLCREEALGDLIAWVKEVSEGVVACRSYNSIPFGRVDF